MPERIEILEDEGVVKIISTGKIEAKDMESSRLMASEICKNSNISKILVDATGHTDRFSLFEAYFHAQALSKDRYLKIAKHAIVYSKINNNDFEFLETTASNRSIMLKIFPTEAEAMLWLNE
jgi:hypothetical protein